MYVRGYISDDAGWLTKFLFEGLGASINVAKPPKGSTVAIFGLGAVGLAVSVGFFSVILCLSTLMFVGVASDYPAYLHE